MDVSTLKVQGFNTGRLYNADGQCIKWAWLDDKTVLFCDTARGIDGYIDQLPGRLRGEGDREVVRAIMMRYDHGHYDQWRKDAPKGWELPEPEGGYGPSLRI